MSNILALGFFDGNDLLYWLSFFLQRSKYLSNYIFTDYRSIKMKFYEKKLRLL